MFDPPPPRPVPHEEVVSIIAQAMRASASGGMTRTAEVYLATACAEHLASRLALAGLVVVREADLPTG